MRLVFRGLSIVFVQAFFLAIIVSAQLGNSGSIEGIVKDPGGRSRRRAGPFSVSIALLNSTRYS